eukprot:gene6604-3258_t
MGADGGELCKLLKQQQATLEELDNEAQKLHSALEQERSACAGSEARIGEALHSAAMSEECPGARAFILCQIRGKDRALEQERSACAGSEARTGEALHSAAMAEEARMEQEKVAAQLAVLEERSKRQLENAREQYRSEMENAANIFRAVPLQTH